MSLKSAQGRAAPIIASAGVFLVALELTIVAAALPAIVSDFSATNNSRVTWIFSAYNLSVAGLLLLFGWVADRIGRRLVFVLGLLLLGLGSLVSGLAGNLDVLIAGRTLQGIGGAMMMPASLAIIMAAVVPAERDKAIALWGAMAGLAAALGPGLGGLLLATLGWRAVFLINVPLVLLASGAALGLLQETRAEHSTQQIGTLGLKLARIARTPSFTWANLATLPFVSGFTAWVIMMPSFFHGVWGYPLDLAALALTPAPLAMIAAANPAARLAAIAGYRLTISVGTTLSIVGMLWWLSMLGDTPNYALGYLPGALLFGAGLGTAFPMLAAAAVREVPPAHYASGSAGVATCRQLAMALGAALAVALVTPQVSSGGGAISSALKQQQSLWIVCAVLLLISALLIQRYPLKPLLRQGAHG